MNHTKCSVMQGSAEAALRGIVKRLLGIAMQQDKRQQKGEGGVRLTGREAEGRLGQKKQNKGKIEFFSEGNRGGKPFTKQLICRLLF